MPDKPNNGLEILNTYIIPTINNIDGLAKCVESLYKYTPHNFRIISIFNGTNEDFKKARELIGDKVHVWVKPYRNLGFAKSMNTGIQMATTPFVTIANDDVEVIYDTWWQDIMALFEKDKELMGFNPHSFINKAASGDRVQEYPTKDEYTLEDIEKMRAFFPKYYIGGCTFFTICKKQLFDEIGLFDESFGQGSGEDYDLDIRASRLGYKIAGGSLVMVKHWWGATKDNLPQTAEFTSNYNMIIKGNERLTEKFGLHCDEVQRRLKDGRMTQEEADEMKGGWSVAGAGGYDEPKDQEKRKYKGKGKWYEIADL